MTDNEFSLIEHNERKATRKAYLASHAKTHLIPYVELTAADSTLEDLILVMAKNVEEALIAAGATKGTDYTYRDLFTWAMPLVLEVWRQAPEDRYTFAMSHF
jgi:hypothetical protein